MLSCDVLLCRLVDLVKYAAIAEEFRLRVLPAAEIIDCRQLQVREARNVCLVGSFGLDRPVEVLGSNLLAFVRIEIIQIGFSELAGALLVDVAVNDGDRADPRGSRMPG